MSLKSLSFTFDMVPIIESIVGEIVTHSSDYSSKLFQRTQLELHGEAVWTCLHQVVGHLGDIKAMHVVVIGHIFLFKCMP